MSERPFAYVCSPFRGDIEKNTERAKEYCRQAYAAGYTPLAPHLYFTQFLNDNKPEERVAGIEMGLALLPQCRVLFVCGGDVTEGMKSEIQQARKLGVEVCSLDNTPSILDQIKQSRQIPVAEQQQKNTNKKHKGDPEL